MQCHSDITDLSGVVTITLGSGAFWRSVNSYLGWVSP